MKLGGVIGGVSLIIAGIASISNRVYIGGGSFGFNPIRSGNDAMVTGLIFKVAGLFLIVISIRYPMK